MIVMHSSKPLHNAVSANGIPLKIIQRIFAIKDKVFPPYSTSLPKGKKARVASLKHCRPIGMPMIVILHKTPAIHQERPCHRPQHRNHIIFPKHPICLSSLQSEDIPLYRGNQIAARPIIPCAQKKKLFEFHDFPQPANETGISGCFLQSVPPDHRE